MYVYVGNLPASTTEKGLSVLSVQSVMDACETLIK